MEERESFIEEEEIDKRVLRRLEIPVSKKQNEKQEQEIFPVGTKVRTIIKKGKLDKMEQRLTEQIYEVVKTDGKNHKLELTDKKIL